MTAIERPAANASALGDVTGPTIAIEVRFTPDKTRQSGTQRDAAKLDVPSETNIGDLIAHFQLPLGGISRVLVNGQDINPGAYAGGSVDLGASISDGDVITFLGPALEVPGTRSSSI